MKPDNVHALLLSVSERLQRAASLAASVEWVLDYQASDAEMPSRAESARAIGEAIADVVRSCVDDVELIERMGEFAGAGATIKSAGKRGGVAAPDQEAPPD